MKPNDNLTYRSIPHGCCNCSHGLSRREFLKGCAAATSLGAFSPLITASEAASQEKTRIALVFLANSTTTPEMWPYPNFDCAQRSREITQALRVGCPQFEFTPVVVATPADYPKALALKDSVDGYLVYVVTLNWAMGLGNLIPQLGKPLIVANEFLGGCGSFLTGVSAMRKRNIPLAAVSSSRLDDLVAVARVFAEVAKPGSTPAAFAQKCEEAYRQTFPAPGKMKRMEDKVALAEIGECLKRLKQSTFLIVGAGQAGTEQTFLNGVKAIHVSFEEFKTHYHAADKDEAAEWGNIWIQEAEKVVDATRPWINKAGGMYLAMRSLMKKYGTENKLFNHWDSWHRVTLYGDVKEPLAELGRALGLKIVEEA